jgi:hypothetical protein
MITTELALRTGRAMTFGRTINGVCTLLWSTLSTLFSHDHIVLHGYV